MSRLRSLVLLCLSPFLAAGATGCARGANADVADQPSVDVPTVAAARVVPGDVSQVLTVTAEFRPFQEIELHAKVAGYVKAIGVDVGDRVHAGQLLATLEVPELQDQLRTDDAAIGRAT